MSNSRNRVKLNGMSHADLVEETIRLQSRNSELQRDIQAAESAVSTFKKKWDTHGGPQGGNFGRALLATECVRLNRLIEVSGWVSCEMDPPAMDKPVFLYEEGRGIWIGGRGEVEFGNWLWGNAYATAWHDGKGWEADIECDDDYKPTLWKEMPALPDVNYIESRDFLDNDSTIKKSHSQFEDPEHNALYQAIYNAALTSGVDPEEEVPIYAYLEDAPRHSLIYEIIRELHQLGYAIKPENKTESGHQQN